ncbi:MAG TPA: hypothetical protein VHV30_14455, partial [Polyangiaceae bacterium]|nr:hypothetical protein [Polyangiaceae bacterium]
LRRFPNDAATAKVANDALAAARPHVYEVDLASSEDYSAAIDEKIVSAERVRESRIFMSAGPHDLMVSWSDGRNQRVAIQATDGGSEALRLDPPAAPPPPVATAVPPTPPATSSVVSPPPPPPTPEAPPATKPFDPGVFIAGAAITGVALGVTVWSGINTEVDPGKDTVIAACMGQTQSCQAYQTGLSHQHRTNVLIGVTSVLAVATAVVGVFFTQWSPVRPAAPSAGGPRGTVEALAPHVEVGPAGVEGTF